MQPLQCRFPTGIPAGAFEPSHCKKSAERQILAFTDKRTSATSRVATFAFDGFATFVERRSFREILVWLACALCCLGMAIACAVLVFPIDTKVYGPVENGWYETFQTLVLGLTTLVLLRLAVRSRHEIFYFSTSLAFLLPFAMVRETPRCGSPFYDGGACLTSDGKVWVVGLAAVMVTVIFAIRRIPLARSWSELTFFYAVPVAFTVLMLIGAELIASYPNAWTAENFVWVEETLELAAYFNLLGLAIALSIWPRWFEAESLNKTKTPKSRLVNAS